MQPNPTKGRGPGLRGVGIQLGQPLRSWLPACRELQSLRPLAPQSPCLVNTMTLAATVSGMDFSWELLETRKLRLELTE